MLLLSSHKNSNEKLLLTENVTLDKAKTLFDLVETSSNWIKLAYSINIDKLALK